MAKAAAARYARKYGVPASLVPLAQKVERFLRQRGSPLADHAGEIVRSANRYYPRNPGLLAGYVVGISGGEQTYGTTGNADVSQYHNAWGYGHPPSGITSRGMFSSWGQGIDTVSKALATDYLGQGLTTPGTMYGRWVKGDPVSTAKQGGYQAPWISTVQQALTAVGSSPGAAPVAPAVPPRPPVAPMPTLTAPPPENEALSQYPMLTLQSIAAGTYRPSDNLAMLQQLQAMPRPTPSVVTTAPKPVGSLTTVGGNTIPVVSEVGKPSSKAMSAIRLAKKYLGTPYSWGGESPGGFDCSGLLQYVWSKQGVTIPRVTYDQWDTGAKVAKNKLRPGDAVFFHMGPRGPEHVGMYLGNDQFIQAPHSGDVVKISKLSTYGGYVGARRYAASPASLAKPQAKPKPAAKPVSSGGPPSTGGPWKRTADGWISTSTDPAWRGTIWD